MYRSGLSRQSSVFDRFLGMASLIVDPGRLQLYSCGTESESAAGRSAERPSLVFDTPVEAGQSLNGVAGCNDCHGAGFRMERVVPTDSPVSRVVAVPATTDADQEPSTA